MRVIANSSLILVVLAFPLAGCGRTSKQEQVKQEKATPLPDPVAEGTALTGTEVTLHVEGMV